MGWSLPRLVGWHFRQVSLSVPFKALEPFSVWQSVHSEWTFLVAAAPTAPVNKNRIIMHTKTHGKKDFHAPEKSTHFIFSEPSMVVFAEAVV